MSALEDEQITAWCFVELDEDIAMVSGRSARENNSSSKVPDVSKDLNALGPNGRDDKGGEAFLFRWSSVQDERQFRMIARRTINRDPCQFPRVPIWKQIPYTSCSSLYW